MYLNNHSYFSLRYGVLPPGELLALGKNMGLDTLALTDINNTSANLEFVRLAPRYGIKPILGIDFRNAIEQKFVALAKNNRGYQELNEFLAHYLHTGTDLPPVAPDFQHCYVIYPFGRAPAALREWEYIGINKQQVAKLRFPTRQHPLNKLVILQPITFRHQQDFNIHRLLRAIGLNTLLSKLADTAVADKNDRPVKPEDLRQAFAGFPQLIENTRQILAGCHIDFTFGDQGQHNNQQTYTGSEAGDYEKVKQLCYAAVKQRYPNPGEEIYARIEKELAIIRQKGFLAYFLINWDILAYARTKGYFYIGRGSGANSIVAYLLRITDVDPIDLDLYFERFINLYRKNPPDFDIDFSWHDRDDITQYIFKKFNHVALLATYNTFQQKAVIRELGKVFGLPAHEIEALSGTKRPPSNPDTLSQLVLRYARLIHGFPSHLSVHASGIIITEKPVHYFTTTFLPPKGYPTTHIDMEIAEDVGLHKFDILSQRGLGKIKEALAIIRYNHPYLPAIDMHNITMFKKDEAVKQLLRQGETIGCFYVESPAMRMLLKKLAVDTYLGLVAASSIIRPGVAKSGMMREYIYRFRHPEEVKQRAHPILLDIMPDTFGVMVYQEDVIKVAHYFAGLTLGEADYLRRGMSGKFHSRSEFSKTKDKFFSNCRQRGIPAPEIAEIWRQIESFAGYAFAKGHSASYAVESYQCLFLKAYFPLEYMVAVINNGGGFYRTETYVHEARMCGATIEAPCINASKSETTLKGSTIFLGLAMIKDVEHKTLAQLVASRQQQGPFTSLANLLQRVPLSIEQVKPLIRVGALRFTGLDKKQLLWEAHFLLAGKKQTNTSGDLFNAPTGRPRLPEFTTQPIEDAHDQIELLGFPLCNPFDLLATAPPASIKVTEMKGFVGQPVTMTGYFVHRKNVLTGNRKLMYFGTFTDTDGHFLDTVHFPEVARQYPFRGPGIYLLKGKVTEEFGYHSLEVSYMEKLPVQVLA